MLNDNPDNPDNPDNQYNQDNPIYSFDKKERLVQQIQKLKKQKYLLDVENIIVKNNPDIYITVNSSGKYLYFHNLTCKTYIELEKYMKYIQNTNKRHYSDNTELITKNNVFGKKNNKY
jgi:hypothetical protein